MEKNKIIIKSNHRFTGITISQHSQNMLRNTASCVLLLLDVHPYVQTKDGKADYLQFYVKT